MSLERAAKNCERCYELTHNSHIKKIYSDDDKKKRLYSTVNEAIYKDNQVFSAMNEAMRALESSPEFYERMEREENLMNLIVASALEACMNCDFSKPNIADIVKAKFEHDKKVGEHNK